ncbi:MAG: hypothetical protein J0L99_04470 [Chitinophagales bacterium]|nr:hypothetical protein [Chitinophagales bacterium]
MKFQDWRIEVDFHDIKFDSAAEEKKLQISMEHTIKLLVNNHDFMPTQ